MTSLVIVESPAKAKTISKFLGSKYIVEASYGHVRDLPGKGDSIPEAIKGKPWGRMAVDIDGGTDCSYEPHYVVPVSSKKHVEKLRKALRECDELLLATDEDREGESISWHLLELLKPKVPVRRIVFHEITPEAIKEALENPRQVDTNLVQAQESRRIIDRLYGYSLSPVLWRKVGGGLSAGRVQSVAVRLVVEREEERRAFRSGYWWDLEAELAAESGAFKATLVSLAGQRLATGKDFDPATGKVTSKKVALLDKATAEALAVETKQRLPWKVVRVEEKPGKQRPASPFTTSTLQQEANRKLGLSAKAAMRAAQNLYEGVDLGKGERVGLITYMRTDSVTLSQRALGEAQDQIRRMYGADYARGPRQYSTKSRNAQEAHEAIRPTSLSRLPQDVAGFLSRDEARLYELVWKRTVASQMPDADVLRTTVEIAARDASGREALFQATGKAIVFPGYLRAYVEGSDDPAAELGDKETILPKLREGQEIGAATPCRLVGVQALGHETQPPARYTEASLVKKLEEEGIGRPSTYASTIATMQERGYVRSVSKALVPTFLAMAVTNLLRVHFPEHVDVKFTARLEEELDEISQGKRVWRDLVSQFFRGDEPKGGEQLGLEQLIAREMERMGLPDYKLGRDPKSGKEVVARIGRYGPYVLLEGVEDGPRATIPEDVAPADFKVEHALELMKARAEGPASLGTDPKSGLPVFVANGRFGPYVQLGEAGENGERPRRASLPKGMEESDITLELALRLLSLPRVLGKHPDDGADVLANIGRFGPYVQHNKEFRSLDADDDPYTMELPRALELLAQPKGGRQRGGASSRTVLKELGEAANGKALQVLDGRYGPYVTDGDTHASLPKGFDPASVTREQALAMIAGKAKSAPAKKGARKAVKKAAKKAPKKAVKKSAKGGEE